MPKLVINRADDSAGGTVLVHVRCNAASKIKREKRDGRDTVVIHSYAAKAGTVLNGVLYPREELEKSIGGLNRTPAPLGHPTVNNKFVPALDPEALARNHIFAWNENPRWDGDRIALDVVIDEARANESEGGRRVLNAIEKQEPICTSTGLLCNLEPVTDRAYKTVARNIEWDHVAILMDEAPAISPEQGVGMLVNADGKSEEIEVVNSILDQADTDLDYAVQSAFSALERRARAPLLDRFKSAIIEAFSGSGRESSTQEKEDDMAVSDEQFNALSGEVKTLSEAINKLVSGLPETISNTVDKAVKPLTDAQAEMVANQKAKDDAEKAVMVEKVVNANLLPKEAAEAAPLTTLRELVKLAEPGKAAAINSAFKGSDGKPQYKLPEGE